MMDRAPAHKDYYSILQVHPKASMLQIKKAYRILAFKFHPDSNSGGDALCTAIFRDVNEAYQILSNTVLRRAYDTENYYTSAPTFYHNVDEWIGRIEALKNYVKTTDPFRINRDGLCFCVEVLLEPNYLLWFGNDVGIGFTKILDDILFIIQPLTYEQAKKIIHTISPLYEQVTAQQTIQSFINKKRRQERWHNSSAYIAIGTAILLCLLIFLFAH